MSSYHSGEMIDSTLDLSELPIPSPQPSQAPTLFSTFQEEVKTRLSSPKKSPKSQVKSRVFSQSHQSYEIPANYQSLVEASFKLGAKQISTLRYYKDLPVVSEKIALCYLLLFGLQIPKSHYWEQFALNLSRPGMFIQLLRHLPFYLESQCEIESLSRIKHIFNSINKPDLKLESRYFELQLLLNLMKEVVSCIKIPDYAPKPVNKVRIPQSTKNKTSKKLEFFSEEEVLRSYDAELLKEAVEAQAKQVRILNGKLMKQQWDEKRYLKEEREREEQRDNEREIDIMRNTVRAI